MSIINSREHWASKPQYKCFGGPRDGEMESAGQQFLWIGMNEYYDGGQRHLYVLSKVNGKLQYRYAGTLKNRSSWQVRNHR